MAGNKNSSLSRRRFLQGCSAAVAAMAGSRLVSVSFAADGETTRPVAAGGRDILVAIFLRGGMDGLNLVGPVSDRNYIEARAASVRLAAEGDDAGLRLANAPGKEDFRLHPKAAALKELYDQKHLAIIHACGLTNGTRSHFEAQDLMERGVADMQQQALSTGWLTRHLETVRPPGLLPGVAANATIPSSLLGYGGAAAIPNPQAFAFYGDERQLEVLARAYAGNSPMARAGTDTLRAMRAIGKQLKHNDNGEILPYVPAEGVNYPGGGLADSLKTVACIAKAGVGLEAAAVDYGGWDTHQEQPNTFPALVEELSSAVAGFYNDMSAYHDRISIVTMSEFGRRLKSNESTGTDHGHGNAMLVLGGNVNGGRIHGTWPGLAVEQLDDRADLAVTTDYRTVLSELLARRLRNGQLKKTFPGMKSYKPLGVFRGDDVPTDMG